MSDQQKQLINGINVSNLKKTADGIRSDPKLGLCEFRVTNQWVNADENRSEAKDFRAGGVECKREKPFHFRAGEPALLEGKDQGANPVEFLLSSLSGCMTTTMAYYAALHEYSIEKMESSYKGELDLQGMFNLDEDVRPGYQKICVHFKIKTDAPKEELERFYHFSPVFDVISKSVPIEVTIETY